MSDKRPIWTTLAALMFAFGLALAQDNGGAPPAGGNGGAPPADNGGGGGGFGGGRRPDPQQMMQFMLNRVKEDLGSSDEEWAALSPKVQEIMKLQFESRPQRGRRGGGPGGPDDQATPQNPVQKATADLRAAVNANAAADDLAKKLQALRDARTASQAELTKAQADLKALLTQRQEAQLVLDGVLE
jgi:hypothetical protein